MQCCQVYGYIRILWIYREPAINGGLLRILPNILLLNVHARVSKGTAGISDSELEPLLCSLEEVSPALLQAVGLSNPFALPLQEICCKNLSCAKGGLKDLTKHGNTDGRQTREKSSAGQRTVSAVF